MIAVKIIGGLGNQLFQYACARHLSLIHNTQLSLDISAYSKYKLHNYGLSNFNIAENLLSSQGLLDLTYIKEKHFHFDPDFKSIPNNIHLNGYWQSEKYFKNISSIIKADLEFKYPMGKSDEKFAELIIRSNSVSLHIRRTDYVVGTYSDQVFDCIPLDYYRKAIHALQEKKENLVFFVFSDDIEWVKKHLRIDYPVFYMDHNAADKNYQDLRLMSLCKYNVIANSSFSWWGAWLNNNSESEVYAPSKWFNSNARNLDSKDIIPDHWIIIPT